MLHDAASRLGCSSLFGITICKIHRTGALNFAQQYLKQWRIDTSLPCKDHYTPFAFLLERYIHAPMREATREAIYWTMIETLVTKYPVHTHYLQHAPRGVYGFDAEKRRYINNVWIVIHLPVEKLHFLMAHGLDLSDAGDKSHRSVSSGLICLSESLCMKWKKAREDTIKYKEAYLYWKQSLGRLQNAMYSALFDDQLAKLDRLWDQIRTTTEKTDTLYQSYIFHHNRSVRFQNEYTMVLDAKTRLAPFFKQYRCNKLLIYH